MQYRNAQYTADGRIDCEIEHTVYGWVPFTADGKDSEQHGRDIFAQIVSDGSADPYIETPPSTPTADDVRAECQHRLRAIAQDYTEAERETWATQVDEARAVLADPAAPAPMLAPLAAARGLTITEMAQRVLDKATAFSSASGAILAAQATLIGTDPIPQDYTADHHWPEVASA